MTVRPPSRLHHTAYVSKDLEKTRAFYEELIGLPLAATWCESDELFGEIRTYCHCFFELADGSALAFFQFASERDQELFGPAMPSSPFHHIALNVDAEAQAAVAARLEAAGYPAAAIEVVTGGKANGEAHEIEARGGRYLSLIGKNPWFHAPEDRWPISVDCARAASIASAVAAMAVAAAR